MDELARQTAIVTGAGRGLGRAIAVALAARGMRVGLVARGLDQLQATAGAIRSQGGEAEAVAADITDADAVGRMAKRIEESLGPVDLLINGAGVARPYGPTWECDPMEWWRTMETNVKGPLLCCRAVVPGMIARKRGRIVNISSGAGAMSIPNMSAYVTSKTALTRFTEVLAEEARDAGVAVFAIHPGTVKTAMAEDLLYSEEGKRWLPWFAQIFEQGRDVTALPAVELSLYLASGQADVLSGRTFTVAVKPADMVEHAQEIKTADLNVLRMRYFPRG